MAWRFKASKFKNATPIVPKPENCVRDVCVGSYQTYGNNIAASALFMAFNVDHNGISLAVLPLEDSGRKGKNMALLHGHTDTVTDMCFSPFHDGLLATGSQDCLIKLWHIPSGGLESSLSEPECVFYSKTQRRVESVLFHPTADGLLSTTSYTALSLWDITTQKSFYSNNDDHSEVIQCINWSTDGKLLATTCKDKQLRILDCRSRNNSVVQEITSHQGIKDSRVVWLNDGLRLLTTGFNGARQREVIIRDIRNLNKTEKSLELDSSTGILLPLYDIDTNMLFLAGKGDTSIMYMEVTNKEPYLVEGLRHNGEQTKGACLVPKRALNVMQGEVNRILQSTTSMIIPIMYQVPRKTYRDFHADLYPDTNGFVSTLSPSDWYSGTNSTVSKISLDPAKRGGGDLVHNTLVCHRGNLEEMCKTIEKKQQTNGVGEVKVEKEQVEEEKEEDSSTVENILLQSLKKLKHVTVEREEVREEEEQEQEEVENVEVVLPPKPLPRSSRSNSFDLLEERPVAKPRTYKNSYQEQQQQQHQNDDYLPDNFEDVSDLPEDDFVTSVITNVPVITGGGYKPRLGPKPFTPPKLHNTNTDYNSLDNNGQNNFDKVFYVPQAPQTKPKTHENKQDPIEQNVSKNLIEDYLNKEKDDTAAELSKKFDLDKSPSYEDKNISKTEVENNKNYDKSPLEIGQICNKISNKKSSNADVVNRKLNNVEVVDNDDVCGVTTSKSVECIKDEDRNGLDRGATHRTSIAERRKMYENRSLSHAETNNPVEKVTTSPTPVRRKSSLKNKPDETSEESSGTGVNRRATVCGAIQPEQATPTPKRTSTVFGRVSKFRHLKGTPMHKSTHIENVRNVSRQISGECDGFHANTERVAVPLSGPGGKIAVLELSKTGRLPDGVIPALVHGTNIMDFCWDPFDNHRLAVGCDDGTVRLWRIPKQGLMEPTNEPETVLEAHSDKIYVMKFHPLASDILATASYDMTIRIWDLQTLQQRFCLTGLTDQIFCMSWSPCGTMLATVCKDGLIRVFKPRQGSEPVRQGKGPVGTRGARLVWAVDGNFIVVIGFDKVSERQIMVYKSQDLTNCLTTVGLDVSPAILLPFYDEDSSTLFLTGRGDSTIFTYEITHESPFVCLLTHHRCSSLHQGISFLNKNVCDVANVEFARALRLTNNIIEPVSFSVPRVKTELFQDDLFPPTKVTWEPTMTSSQWLSGANKLSRRISLKPEGMDLLSSSQNEKVIKNSAVMMGNMRLAGGQINEVTRHKQEQIQKAVSSKLEVNLSLEQDKMEGVDEQEWDD